ncbi:hypothetical protein C5167_043145 [Papaver somniferum]|uniref:Uncharacterized protein n=1 Tax=Papaver somniferum TaxID=3469 RepID=A0A4Y7L881_PAPSO|nr:hypothetical protein C5167_015221 [Papaver somniferum]RZC80551.1 hypothetical protein C5167_043145 [Papaver somniferum]
MNSLPESISLRGFCSFFVKMANGCEQAQSVRGLTDL